jgi:HK97 family phage portal protein
MGLIKRIKANRSGAESRTIGGVPWRPWDSPFWLPWKFSQGGPVHPTRQFFGVDEALGLPALYACVRLLADSLASLPVKVYLKQPSGRGPSIPWTGPSMFDKPAATGTIYDWLFQCMTSLLLQGNAWGLITGRDGYGFPSGIEWLPPEDVVVVDDEEQPWNPQRARIYVFGRLMDRDELFHVKAFAVPGRTEGISPLRAFALTVTSGLEAERYGTDWYKSGGFPPGTFQNNEIEIDSSQAAEIREALVTSLRRREPLVYGRDWDYKPVVVPPSESQFLQATQMNATQIAAVYGLPPDRVGGNRGDSLTYNTVEMSTLQIIEALRPWLVRLETAFFDIIPSNRYVRFNTDALLKTDLKTRTEIYAQQRSIGMRTTDEIRDLEDLPPLPGAAGGETIPLDVMVAMSRSIRAIPTSMMEGLTLEIDLIAAKLEKLQTEGIAAPDVPGVPVAPSPEAMLGQSVGAVRSAAGLDPETLADEAFIRAFLAERRKRRVQAAGPEYIGPWLSGQPDLADQLERQLKNAKLNGTNGHASSGANGNGGTH